MTEFTAKSTAKFTWTCGGNIHKFLLQSAVCKVSSQDPRFDLCQPCRLPGTLSLSFSFVRGSFQETLTLRFRSCFPNTGTYGLALVNQIFDSDSCLAGVPLRVTFANYESTFPKPRMDKNKTTNPFGQTPKKVLDCSRSHISKLRTRISRLRTEIFKLRWRSSTWNFQTTNGPKILLRNQNSHGKEQPRNYEARGRTVRCVLRDNNIRHSPPQTPPSNPPRPPLVRGRLGIDLTLIRHRFRVKSGTRCRINVKSMPSRPLTRGGRGGFEDGVWRACA